MSFNNLPPDMMRMGELLKAAETAKVGVTSGPTMFIIRQIILRELLVRCLNDFLLSIGNCEQIVNVTRSARLYNKTREQINGLVWQYLALERLQINGST